MKSDEYLNCQMSDAKLQVSTNNSLKNQLCLSFFVFLDKYKNAKSLSKSNKKKRN